ncbi:MAG TPA: HAD hydrolase-like protein [Gemmatimonadaceae bacterium]|jgi:phosphoglycolate phosphatase
MARTLEPVIVLFDLDGTLSDPLPGIARSINDALSHFGYPERDPSDLAVYIGPPLDETFRSLTGVRSAADIAALVARYRERYAAIGYSENVLYPGITEALEVLTGAGITLGLCTSKRADFAEKILGMFAIRSHFRFVSGGDIGIDKAQQIATLAAEGLVDSTTLMVGDRAVDLIAAHRNGLQAAGVLWGYGSRAELAAEHPSHLFSSPADLRTLADAKWRSESGRDPSRE